MKVWKNGIATTSDKPTLESVLGCWTAPSKPLKTCAPKMQCYPSRRVFILHLIPVKDAPKGVGSCTARVKAETFEDALKEMSVRGFGKTHRVWYYEVVDLYAPPKHEHIGERSGVIPPMKGMDALLIPAYREAFAKMAKDYSERVVTEGRPVITNSLTPSTSKAKRR